MAKYNDKTYPLRLSEDIRAVLNAIKDRQKKDNPQISINILIEDAIEAFYDKEIKKFIRNGCI